MAYLLGNQDSFADPAAWIRSFVQTHPEYMFDSVVSDVYRWYVSALFALNLEHGRIWRLFQYRESEERAKFSFGGLSVVLAKGRIWYYTNALPIPRQVRLFGFRHVCYSFLTPSILQRKDFYLIIHRITFLLFLSYRILTLKPQSPFQINLPWVYMYCIHNGKVHIKDINVIRSKSHRSRCTRVGIQSSRKTQS